jgi:drug/metabolite transporter (DMT)-like permease
MLMNKKRLGGFFCLLGAAMLFSSFTIYIRRLGHDFTTYQQVYLRNITALVFGVIALHLSKQKMSSIKNIPRSFLPLALSFPVSVVLFTFSVQHTKIATSIFALYAASLITSVIAGAVFFGEKLKGARLIAFLLAFVGIAVYASPYDKSVIGFGLVMGFLSGIADGLANLYRKVAGSKN